VLTEDLVKRALLDLSHSRSLKRTVTALPHGLCKIHPYSVRGNSRPVHPGPEGGFDRTVECQWHDADMDEELGLAGSSRL
jgi:hypothetical protein